MEDNELIRDIFQRLGGIEAKIDDVRSIRDKVNEAHTIATQALQLALRHEAKFEKLQDEANAQRRWLIATIASSALSLAGLIVSLVT